MTKFEEMREAALAGQRRFREQQQKCWQYGILVLNGFSSYCQIPSDRLRLLRWNDVTGELEDADPDMRYTISGAMQFNEGDQCWRFGVYLSLTGTHWVQFNIGVSDSDGQSMLTIGPGKARHVDLNDQTQCNAFFESIVETVKDCYRDRQPSRIGFTFNPEAADTVKQKSDMEPVKKASGGVVAVSGSQSSPASTG